MLLALLGAALLAVSIGAAVAPPTVPRPILVLAGRSAVVGDLTREQTRFCATLHASALPHGFFVALGPRFLRRYFESFADSPHAVAMVATVDDHPVGFLVGPVRARSHRQWVVRNRGLGLALAGATALAVRPGLAWHFVRTRLTRYRVALRRDAAPAPHRDETPTNDVAVLSHVAVLEGARHTGAGTLLVSDFEDAARDAGIQRAYLHTLDGPDGAGPFYSRLGWHPGPTHPTAEGRRMQEWTRTLGREPGA
ncbi:GNAT family N-acetyltransferase [Conexibacter sp. W3-3-2]|uniref:GNAT family N-acetyltransferase n=1 Tax=Conexibacter sp. W3-3-2 TaxID=2675227 RepID=UPI001E559BFE|nr:GNAT family N-acetyltransferase [Conexibacter sp. W3-3-2]